MIRVKLVEACHFVCAGDGTGKDFCRYVDPSPLLPKPAREFWEYCDFAPCAAASIALDGSRLVGFFRFYRPEPKRIHAAGTWVNPRYRGQGIGLKLWSCALRASQIKAVTVTAISTDGERLVASVQGRFPRVSFDLNP